MLNGVQCYESDDFMTSPFTTKTLSFSARVEAQQRSRMVPRAQGRIRARTCAHRWSRCSSGSPTTSNVCTGTDRRSEGLAVSHLPRHALQQRQDAAQDARRGALSDARRAEGRRRRPLLRDCAGLGLDGRRHVHADRPRSARHSRADCGDASARSIGWSRHRHSSERSAN